MGGGVDRAQMLNLDMGVNLGGVEIGMAQKRLENPHIGAAF
jgi:hypothetical protein